MGIAYDQKGNYPLAQAAYDRAMILKPNEPSVLNNAALSYLQSGDIETAERMVHDAEAASTPAEKPRIEQTVALVERLQSSRPATPAPTRRSPEPAPAPAQLASAAPPPPAPQYQPAPEYPAAPGYDAFNAPSEPNEPIITNTPVDSYSLPPPEAEVET